MSDLQNSQCEPCQGGIAPLDEQQLGPLLAEVPAWTLIEEDSVEKLQRRIDTADFNASLALAQRVGELADQQDHHPAILVEYGQLTVTWWSHKIKGLHRNDFVCAAKTDALINGG